MAEQNPFHLFWKIKDFSLWAGGKDSCVEWPSTSLITIDALGGTQWKIDLCPRTYSNMITCCFQRPIFPTVEQEHVSFEYSIYIQGANRLFDCIAQGIAWNLKPGDAKDLDIIHRRSLQMCQLPNDLLTIAFLINPMKQVVPVDFYHDKWRDDLETLSSDMRKLFERGYFSDVKLVSDDGRRIAVHKFVLYARWRKLLENHHGRKASNRIAVHGVSGSALSAFASYLYTGKLDESDVTPGLYDFAIENADEIREHFNTRMCCMCFQTIQKKDNLSFTWHAGDLKADSMPFFRVLPLTEMTGYEVLVDLDTEPDCDTDERYLAVTFSLTETPDKCWISFLCTATLVIDDSSVFSLTMTHYFESHGEWHFPNFIPMRLLTSVGGERLTRRRVQFELSVSDGPRQTYVPQSMTEFRTGSLGVSQAEVVARDFREFFKNPTIKLTDVTLRTVGGCFLSCRAFLSARSQTFRRFFQNHKKKNIVVCVSEKDSVLLAEVLQYMYTGWTKLPGVGQNLNMYPLARRLGLFGLVRKCHNLISICDKSAILQTSAAQK